MPRVHDDPVDETAQDAERLIAERRIGKRFVELRDLAAIETGEVREQAGRRDRAVGQFLLERLLSALQSAERSCRKYKRKRIIQALNAARPMLCPSPRFADFQVSERKGQACSERPERDIGNDCPPHTIRIKVKIDSERREVLRHGRADQNQIVASTIAIRMATATTVADILFDRQHASALSPTAWTSMANP